MAEPRPDQSATPALPGRVDWARHALFLDFDGTLAPLRDRPEEVALEEATVALLGDALREMGGAVAILSGRSLENLASLVGPLTIPLSGSHGAERWQPGDAPVAGTAPAPALEGAYSALAPLAQRDDLLLERKPGAVALHYRNRPELAAQCREAVTATAEPLGLRALHGNMVSEAALAGVDKGTALRDFLARPPFAGRCPIMIGDDTTDEDGFAAAQAEGGFGLRIGGSRTCAHYRVEKMTDALAWLAGTLNQ